jgi:hypothetical protein
MRAACRGGVSVVKFPFKKKEKKKDKRNAVRSDKETLR